MIGYGFVPPTTHPLFLPNEKSPTWQILDRFLSVDQREEKVRYEDGEEYVVHYASDTSKKRNEWATRKLGKPIYGTVILSKNGGKLTDEEFGKIRMVG